MIQLNAEEKAIYVAVERLGRDFNGVNELSILYACPHVSDFYKVLQGLVKRGVLERVGVSNVRIAANPPKQPISIPVQPVAPATPNVVYKRPRKRQFAKLGQHPVRGLAARIIDVLEISGLRTKRELERDLHACRSAEWNRAVDWLFERHAIAISENKITLTSNASIMCAIRALGFVLIRFRVRGIESARRACGAF